LLRRLCRALSRRDYDQPRALKPVFGLARPSLAWSKELLPRQHLHDLPPCRLVASRPRPNSLPLNQGHLMARDPVPRFWLPMQRGERQRLDAPPFPGRGVVGLPDPVEEKEKNPNKRHFFNSNYEVNGYYLSSRTNPRGFSHGKTKSQCQHTKAVNFTVARRYLTEREVERLMNTARKHSRMVIATAR
jgi:hypothetical protein